MLKHRSLEGFNVKPKISPEEQEEAVPVNSGVISYWLRCAKGMTDYFLRMPMPMK